MTRSCKVLLAFFLLLLIVSGAASQQSSPTNELEQKRQRQQLQAISMIQQTAAEAVLWNDKKAAVRALADAADLLWYRTPDQAAKWLRKAWDLTGQVSESPKDERLKEYFTRSDQTDLRSVVLGIARKHDAELAEKLLKELSQKELNEKKNRGAFDDRTARSEQLLQLAQQAVDEKPGVAFSLAEASLADGISYGLQNVLTSLRKKNTDMANRLFDLALGRFGSGQPDPSEAEVLAGYLFQSGVTFSATSTGQTILVMNPAQQNLPSVASSEPQRARNFLTAVYDQLLARPIALDSPEGKQRAQQILVLGNHVAGRYNTFAPELAQAAQGFLAQLQRQLSPDGDTVSSSETQRRASANEDSTKHLTKEEIYEMHVSELEDSADKESNSMFKKMAYIKAALATKPEDYQRAKRIAEKIDDDDLRADAVSFVLYRAALFFVEKPEIERAVEIATAISDISRRAVVKIAIAQHLLASRRGNLDQEQLNLTQQTAFDLLSDIEKDLKKEGLSANAVKILLGRTAVLARLDKDQALASLEQAVQMINKLDKFDLRDGAAPDLSLGALATSGAMVARPRIGFDFRSAIEPIINIGFEQLAVVPERITSKELRGVGRLEVARLYLKMNSDSAKNESPVVVR